MNRYFVTGVVADALGGRRVLVFLASLRDAKYAYQDVVAHLKKTPLPHVQSAHSRMVVFPSGGEIVFTSVAASSARGREADVLVAVGCELGIDALTAAVTSHAPRGERVVA